MIVKEIVEVCGADYIIINGNEEILNTAISRKEIVSRHGSKEVTSFYYDEDNNGKEICFIEVN